nr:hypothetical protein [Desulfobacterales bacterium]
MVSFFRKIRDFLSFNKRRTRDSDPDYDPQMVRFFMSDDFQQLEKRYAAFKLLLSENNAILGIMSDLQERVDSQLITPPYFKKEVSRLLSRVIGFVEALNEMCQDKYPWLIHVAEGIRGKIEKRMEMGGLGRHSYVYPLAQLDILMASEVGGKAASLGEVKNILHIPVPSGFVVSSWAYSEFISVNGIDRLIDILMGDVKADDERKIQEASRRIQEAILEADVPPAVVSALSESLAEMGGVGTFAVRSSAIGEDGKYSFAGLFRSVLGVSRDKIIDAYKEVCTSLYGERAIRYRLAKRIPQDHQIAMAVLVLETIPAVASGVLYTLDPTNPESDTMIITAVWGLGKSAVEGYVSPDIYILDRKGGGRLINQTIGKKDSKLSIDPVKGIIEEGVPIEKQVIPCLREKVLHTLYEFGQVFERHFGAPQDVEWLVDRRGWVYILQTRTLALSKTVTPSLTETQHTPVISGDPVSPGITSGPVFLVQDRGISSVPTGSIVAVKTMDPEFAKFIPSAGGLIAETGSLATHLASISREFHKPAIVNAQDAVNILRNGEMVTLDAHHGKVYRGRIDSIIKTKYFEPNPETHKEGTLAKVVLKDIVPLTLTQISDNINLRVAIRPNDFKTIHDIIRFVHEASVREMFHLNPEGESAISHILLDPRVPLTFYVIDIGGALSPRVLFKRKIAISDIYSKPFRSLWEGMTHKNISWSGQVQFHLGSFFSVVSRSFIEGNISQSGGKAYVILSKEYLNFQCRLAYHFTGIDAVSSDTSSNNYITFRFEGGGAGADGRIRRALLIKEILEALYFRIEVKGDFLTGIFRGSTCQEVQSRLDQLGRLMGFTRQLDMTLQDEATRRRYAKAFLEGNYSPEL